MKIETVKKANDLLTEINIAQQHLSVLQGFKERADNEIEKGYEHTLTVKIFNPAAGEKLLLVDEVDILETAILKTEKYLKKKNLEFDKLKEA